MFNIKSERPKEISLEKLRFLLIEENTKLSDLITPDSFKFFDILELDCAQLNDISDKWQEHASYLIERNFLIQSRG